MVATLLVMTSVMQATDYTLTFTNNTANPVYVYIAYLKDKHKHNQGNSITIAPSQTADVKFTDKLQNIFVSKSSKSVNKDGVFSGSKNDGDVYAVHDFTRGGGSQQFTITQASDGSLTVSRPTNAITNKTGQSLQMMLSFKNGTRTTTFANNKSYHFGNESTLTSICMDKSCLTQPISPDKSYNVTLASDNKTLVLSPV